MSGHEFEKQVRQKLNDLKLTPSAEAWENIERNLREKKRRLAPVFWLPLLLIGLTAGGFLFYRSFDDKDRLASTEVKELEKTSAKSPQLLKEENVNEQKENVSEQKEENSSGTKSTTAPLAPQVKEKTPGGNLKTSSDESEINLTAAPEATKKKENKASAGVSLKTSSDENEINLTTAPKATKKKENKASAGISLKTSSDENEINLTTALQPAKKKEGDASTGWIRGFEKIPSLSLSNEKSIISAPSLPIHNTSSTKPSIQKKKSGKWSYGLSGVAGVSSVSEGNFLSLNFNKAEVEDVATVAIFAPQPYRPSAISPGFTYSVGGFVKRELSKKFSLSMGVNYLQLNTRNKVGSRINARQVVNNGTRGYLFVSSYYTLQQDQPSEYRNRYHFIEVPVELHTRVNKSEKVQLFVNTGMAVSRLLKSNSLHFDGSSGVYYKNDKLLNQTQVSGKVGFSFGLLNNTTRPIWIGPYARYNISRILQKDVSASKSFASFGLDMKLFIK